MLRLQLGLGIGPFLSPNSEPAMVQGSEKGTSLSSTLPNQGSAQSFLQTPNLQEFGERNWPLSELRTCQTRVWPGPLSELSTCRTKFRPCPFSEFPTCQGSELEKGTVLSPNQPNHGLARSFLRTKVWPCPFNEPARVGRNLPNQGSTRSILRTPNLPEF